MKEALRIPTLMHYFYFLASEEEAIKEVWNTIISAYDLKEDAVERRELLIKEISAAAVHQFYTTSLLKSFSGKNMQALLFLFKDIAIIEILFFSLWKEQLSGINSRREEMKELLSSAFGEATVIVVEDIDKDVLNGVKNVFSLDAVVKTQFVSCTVFHLITDEERRFYACKAESEAAFHFLAREFPAIDVSVQKLMKEAGYLQKQHEWIAGERIKIDKSIGEILHRQVVGIKLESEKMGAIEGDISELSRMYGLLATDAVMVKSANTSLSSHAGKLNEFIKSILKPEGNNGIEQLYIKAVRQQIGQLGAEEINIRNSVKNVKTAIDVVKSRIELVRSEESLALQEQTKKLLTQNIVLQEEGISLQVAASFIEFIILFYYSLSSWEHLISLENFEHIPVLARFFSVLAFATSVVVCTHFVAKSYKENWKLSRGLLFSSAAIFASLGIMVALSLR